MTVELHVIGSDRPALVDDEFGHLRRYRWRLGKDGYAMRHSGGKKRYLHHHVLPGKRWPEYVRDHINRDKMDARKVNLRWIEQGLSKQNCDAYAKSKTGKRGVFPTENGRYYARVQVEQRSKHLGTFDTIDQAHRACVAFRSSLMPLADPST